MMIYVVDAFTTKANEGNRAGVVLDASSLSSQEMQKIACFAGYSETAFILPPYDDTHKIHVRYFTPTHEVPICGHATIAAHYLRALLGHHDEYPLVAKTGAGNLPISLSQCVDKNLMVSMTQGEVEFQPPFNPELRQELADALGVCVSEFTDSPVQVVSTGHSKVLALMKSKEVLDALAPKNEHLIALSKKIGCNGFFPFVLLGEREQPITFGRMFAPAIGIDEDPVTGNANGPVGAYLVKHNLVECQDKISYWGFQGFALGKPGKVFVSVERIGYSLNVNISGQATLVGERKYDNSSL